MGMKEIEKICAFVNKSLESKPEIALILGSGLGEMAEDITEKVKIKYQDIPEFPVSTVEGHSGCLISGRLAGKNVIAMQGRVHYYEGYSMQEITIAVRVFKKLGVEKIIITNAAGGVNLDFEPGDLILITDHINLMGDNPLRGENQGDLPRFPDMSEAYSKKLIRIAEKVALQEGLLVRKGIYAGVAGPSYETPAEIRFLRNIGADMVGMSTVPEVIVANQEDIEVLGISCITNMAAGVLPRPLDHREVMEIAKEVRSDFISLVKSIVSNI